MADFLGLQTMPPEQDSADASDGKQAPALVPRPA
jgi:hypothetical protein